MMQKEENNHKCDVRLRGFLGWSYCCLDAFESTFLYEITRRERVVLFAFFFIWHFRFWIGGLDLPDASLTCAYETEGRSWLAMELAVRMEGEVETWMKIGGDEIW
jgi:hypothetical protein